MDYLALILLIALIGGVVSLNSAWKPDYDGLFLNKTSLCGESIRTISQEQIYRIEISEEDPPATCLLQFKAQATNDCSGSCYIFVPNAFVRKDGIQLSIANGENSVLVNSTSPVKIGPHCSTTQEMTLYFTIYPEYKFNMRKREFHFTLEIYNKCGKRGSVKNIKYEEALEYMAGYAPGEEEQKERLTYIAGISLGFGLASVFLCGLLIACCHSRTSPARGNRKSYDKSNVMKITESKDQRSKDIEMGVSNTKVSVSGRENKPLLNVATSDPKKCTKDTSATEK